jgi:hypothetical protein
MFDFVCAGKVFFFRSPCNLRDLDGAMTSPRFDMTSSRPLRLHVDRGLRDMGTHGSPQRTRPVRSPADLQVGLKTLSTTPATLEDSRRPYADPGESSKLVAQDSPPGRGSTLPVGPQITRFAL